MPPSNVRSISGCVSPSAYGMMIVVSTVLVRLASSVCCQPAGSMHDTLTTPAASGHVQCNLQAAVDPGGLQQGSLVQC